MKKIIICLIALLTCVSGAAAATKAKNNGTVTFKLYGTEMQVRLNTAKRVRVKKATPAEIAKCNEWIEAATGETLQDCKRLKQEKNLCDWAYVRMLAQLSETALGQTNEATLLMTALLKRSGYDAILAYSTKDKVVKMLYHTDATILESPYYQLAGKAYYTYGGGNTSSSLVMDKQGGSGQKIDFRYQGEVRLDRQLSEPRTLATKDNPDFSFSVQADKALMDFYNDMPQFYYDGNIITRWTTIADRPLERRLQDTLVKEMKQKLAGKSQREQVNILLNFAQKAMDYQYDEEVWGYDRAFYSEETLFYPANDTEDRSILLSRLVRDVVGLDVLFVWYPAKGHTAIAVCFTDADVRGAYIVDKGRHYVICDPTLIGGVVGMEIPTMEKEEKQFLPLQ